MAPHAPLLLAEVAGPVNAARTERLAAAVSSVDLSEAEAVVIASPHGTTPGVYATAAGDLNAFGPRGIAVAPPTDDALVRELAGAWGRPILDGPADHGVVVPLRLLDAGAPVAAVSLDDDGVAFARALRECVQDRRVAFVASANLSAGLGPGAPLPSLDGAEEADAAVLDALRGDPGSLTAQRPALESAGSCSASVLAAFGTLFAGHPCEVLAYDAPFGVGHVVAVAR